MRYFGIKYRVGLILLAFILSQAARAQNSGAFKWFNPANSAFHVIEGQAWPKEVEFPYDRFPLRAEQTVNAEVWKLSQQSAGLVVRFKTNAEQITIRYQVNGPLAMAHMPTTGVSGIDLYGIDAGGSTLWCAGKYSFKDTIECKFIDLKPAKTNTQTGIEYRLYLPLYNSVKWLEIGTPQGSSFTPLPVREVKPIVIYGTSITQGACASRPGMAFTAIVSRKLNIPLVNLGFSGTGRLEKEVLDLVNEIDARVYILDCLPNLVGGKATFTKAEIYNRIINAVKQIRKAHPQTPVILTDHFGFTDAAINPLKREQGLWANKTNHEAFAYLKAKGFKNISLLPTSALHQDMDTMVDGIHPTDLGMTRYAAAYLQLLKTVLAK
jgi:lysophospholipase L1-like esterase